MQTRVALSALARYWNLAGSNSGWARSSSSGAMMAPGNTAPIIVPSFGATEKR